MELFPVSTRNLIYKVRLSQAELDTLKEANILNVARFLRESALNNIHKTEKKQVYTKLDRDFLLELSRIGNNINQIAKAINLDLLSGEPLDKVQLLHLLISINENLEAIKEDLK
jgi:hypothetical protein